MGSRGRRRGHACSGPGCGGQSDRRRPTWRACGVRVHRADCRRDGERKDELAGLPLLDEVLQPAENAHQAGDDQGVQRRRHPDMPPLCGASGTQAGELLAQGG